MRNIRGALFDLDGTLLDSMPVYDNVIADMMLSLGYTPSVDLFEEVRQLSGTEVLIYLRDTYKTSQSAEELEAALDKLLYEYYSSTPPLKPGVLRILETLKKRGVPMCVATATNRIHVEAALRRTGIDTFFERIFTCAEENLGKSQPYFFIKAAEFLGCAPEDTYIFEDALHAVRSAKKAGLYVVAVRDLAEDVNRETIISLADEFYDNLEEFSL